MIMHDKCFVNDYLRHLQDFRNKEVSCEYTVKINYLFYTPEPISLKVHISFTKKIQRLF